MISYHLPINVASNFFPVFISVVLLFMHNPVAKVSVTELNNKGDNSQLGKLFNISRSIVQ